MISSPPSVLTILTALHIVSQFGLGISQETKLVKALLANYNPYTRPVWNSSDAIKMEMGVPDIYIRRFDPTREILDLILTIKMKWKDEFLSWDPYEFGQISAVILPGNRVWSPDITTPTLLHSPEILSPDSRQVFSNGDVVWTQRQRLQVLCPLEKQGNVTGVYACKLDFVSWSYNGFQLALKTMPYSESQEAENLNWRLSAGKVKLNVLYYACCPEPFPNIELPLQIHEKQKLDKPTTANSRSPRSALTVLRIVALILFSSLVTNVATSMLTDY